MPDFRVADTAPEHPKLRAAGLAAAGLWSLAGAVAMRDLTDGWVPEYWVATWPAGKRHAATLVKVGLWRPEERRGIPGYGFHDWDGYQRSASQINDEKTRAKDRAAKSYANSAESLRRRKPESAAQKNRICGNSAEILRDSLSLSLSLSPGSEVGGVSPDSNGQVDHDPPTPNLDPNNPRCGRHRDVPTGDPGPHCRHCRDVRIRVEQTEPDAAGAERQARQTWRTAVDACPDCDENGKIQLPGGALARHHDTAEVPS